MINNPAPFSNYGTATINFGAFPGLNETTIVVTGQPTIASTAKIRAFIMGDDTTGDHTANDHRYAAALISFTCGTIVAGTGFTIRGISLQKMQGTFSVRWTWIN